VVPEKQGLKRCPEGEGAKELDSLSSGSRKTRIETRKSRGGNMSIWPGLSSGSRKTRIETERRRQKSLGI